MTVRQHKVWAVWLLLLVFVGFYASFLTADILTADSDNVYSKHAKYLAVLLCLILVMSIGRHGHDTRDRILLQSAFVGIAAADFTIGILGRFLPGLALFLAVQLILLFRHLRGVRFSVADAWSLGIIVAFGGLVFTLAFGLLREAGLLIPAAVYAVVLLVGLWAAERARAWSFFPSTSARLILVGMALFLLCDLNVALWNALAEDGRALLVGHVPAAGQGGDRAAGAASVVAAVPFSVRQVLGILVWAFYLPCLVLLVLSGFQPAFLRRLLPRSIDSPLQK